MRARLVLILCCIAVSIFADAAKNPAESEFHRALFFHSHGELRLAAESYRNALMLDPSLVSAAVNLAIIHEKWGDSPSAEALYNSAVRVAPELFSTRYNRGQFLQKHGRLAEARADYLVALEKKPGAASVYVNLAAIEIRLFEETQNSALLSAAAEKLRQAEKLKHKSAALYFNKARLAEFQNSYGQARTQYHEAMRRYPVNSAEYRLCALRIDRLSRQLAAP